jgi:methanogenic corrinoid protein MtbC1
LDPFPEEVYASYLERVLDGDTAACLGFAQTSGQGVAGLHRLYVELIQPVQYQVGDLWEGGKISVALEHLATATNTFVALSSYVSVAPATAGGPRGLVACTPDEMHELGARLTADLLECDGWDVDFLGASMPLRDLIGAIRRRQPRFVGLSAALVHNLGSVQTTIRAIRDALGPDAPPIIVGGNAFRGDVGLWKAVGADRYAADASTAVELLREFK